MKLYFCKLFLFFYDLFIFIYYEKSIRNIYRHIKHDETICVCVLKKEKRINENGSRRTCIKIK